MKKCFSFGLMLIGSMIIFFSGKTQDVPAQYINEALKNNLVLNEKKVSLDKGLIALKEARSLFLPTTWLETQYTLAKGGRSIDIPVGDLLNPVYKSLNQLTRTSGFPAIKNRSEQLLPNNFYDARLKTTLPLIDPDLKINRDIKQQQTLLQQNEIDIYKRELIKEVKIAYYNYLMAGEAVHIYENALQAVNENLRINKSLLANGKGLPAYVSRAESEVKQVESQLHNSVNEHQNTQAYFNFLLNKPFTDSIITAEIIPDQNGFPLSVAANDNISGREEIKSLNISRDINLNIHR